MLQMAKKHPKRDYTRVIDAHKYAPIPASVGFTIPTIVGQVQVYIRNRADSFTIQKREHFGKELKDYKGFLVFQDKENAIRKDLSTMVNEDQQLRRCICDVRSSQVSRGINH